MNGFYPTTEQGLRHGDPAGQGSEACPVVPLSKELPQDPWETVTFIAPWSQKPKRL
jgi:hypothetical protein